MKTQLVLLFFRFTAVLGLWVATGMPVGAGEASPAATWKVGQPIVTYWAGPAMTDAVAQQMAEGGWNVVWCGEKELDLVGRHGLRAQLQSPLLAPGSLEEPEQRGKLDALIDRARPHPALYSYFITDEPSATNFTALGKLVAYLRQRDPAHLAYINLFPTYASNQQLGNTGEVVTAYQTHLRQYTQTVRPGLISYDHYQFTSGGDSAQYFLNLALIRRAAQEAAAPFLNIVQACSWTPSMRVPQGDEMRYLVYTTLAYGAQGISYYVYSHPGHSGGIANADGTPTPLYPVLKGLNREFVAIARQLQPLRSLGVYHAGMLPPGTEPLPEQAAFRLEPAVGRMDYRPPAPVKGFLLGYFGAPPEGSETPTPTHALVVNLDYATEATVGLRGPSQLELFDPATGQWSKAEGSRSELRLPRGGGKLARVSAKTNATAEPPPAAKPSTVEVLVAYYSLTGNTEQMAQGVVSGIQRVPGAAAHLKKVDEVAKADLEAADAIVLGCPTYYGNIPGRMKVVIDDWSWKMKVDFTDKVGGAFASGGGQVGGKEFVVISLLTFMLNNRMVVAGPLYRNEVTGSVWGEVGAAAMTGPLDPGVSPAELDSARRLGERVAQVARKMKAGASVRAR